MKKKSFNKLLDWLSSNKKLAPLKYVTIYSELVIFFQKKGCIYPTECADKTIDRVCLKLSTSPEVLFQEPSVYISSVSKYILKEYWRQQSKHNLVLLDNTELIAIFDPSRISEFQETLQVEPETKYIDCMKKCIQCLSTTDRRLLMFYYKNEDSQKRKSRRKLAIQMQISEDALRTKVYRIRKRLHICLKKCLEKYEE